MKLTIENLIELRNIAAHKLHFGDLHSGEKRTLQESFDSLEATIEEMDMLKLNPLKLSVDDNMVIYGKGEHLIQRMRLPEFTFELGIIEKQYDGGDISRHGRAVYEKISEIKNIDDNTKVIINNNEPLEFLQKDFCKVNDLENAVQKQYDSLETQIQMMKEEQKNLLNNYHIVVDSFRQRDLVQKEEQELEEIEL